VAKKIKFQSPNGMHDIFGENQKYFEKIYDTVKEIAEFYNFEKIETPILEETELFSKGIGLTTDVVQKEMYSLRTKGGHHLTLRPEGTASIVRAYIQNGMQNLPKPIKLWYFGPFFRHEKPQQGRFRQFWQFGFEVIGEASPVRDAGVIQIFYNILKSLKLKNIIIEVNSIGGKCCRPSYRKSLLSYFKSRANGLCINCRKRIKENPLRILDCKEEKCQRIVSQAPQMIESLCQVCRQHFKGLLEFLDEVEIPYNLNPYLVRGLDYYTKTVFELFSNFSPPKEDKNQESKPKEESPEVIRSALGGGGRYDSLIKVLGGKDSPAIGAAGGVDRIVELMKNEGISLPKTKEPQVFLTQLGSLPKRKALKLMEDFRKEKIEVLESLGRDSLRAQLAVADRSNVKYSLILGQKEALDGIIILRHMTSGHQKIVKLEDAAKEMKKILKKS
jgi:histidyl-tRNA synthetase